MDNPSQESRYILGQRVDYTTYNLAAGTILDMAQNGRQGYVCISTVHMVMEGVDDPAFQGIVNGADLVTPDGVPLVWALKLLGIKAAERVYGPTLTPHVCAAAAQGGVSVGFYGGTDEILAKMQSTLMASFPELNVVYAYSPPFRPLTEDEDGQQINDILSSGAGILLVGLGCPKQERWMAAHTDLLSKVVLIGVGAAFDFIAGAKAQAPSWVQRAGMEWLFRLVTEPRRLWRRYLYHNPRFLYKFAGQLLRARNIKT